MNQGFRRRTIEALSPLLLALVAGSCAPARDVARDGGQDSAPAAETHDSGGRADIPAWEDCTLENGCRVRDSGLGACCFCCPNAHLAQGYACEIATGRCIGFCNTCIPPGWRGAPPNWRPPDGQLFPDAGLAD